MNPLALLVITIAALNFIVERLFPILPDVIKGLALPITKTRPNTATQPGITNTQGPVALLPITIDSAPTPTAALTVSPTIIASLTSDSGGAFDWVRIYNLGKKTREPFKLIDKEETEWLINNAGPITRFRQRIERAGKVSKSRAKDAAALRAVLDHIAVTPTRNAYESVLDLQRRLVTYTTDHYWGSDVEQAVPLIDSVLDKLAAERSGWARQKESDEEALFRAFEQGSLGYCLGTDCGWAERVVRARELTDSIIDMLVKKLGGIKAQVIEDARKDRETLAYVGGQLKWMLPLYIVLMIAARLLSMGYGFAGNPILEEDAAEEQPQIRVAPRGDPVLLGDLVDPLFGLLGNDN